jgi:hypothetical protein
MNKKLLILPIFLMFVGCASNSSGSTEERESKDIPEWALEPPCPETSVCAVGQAKKQNPSLSKKTAVGRARSEVSQVISTKVATLFTDFMQESGVGDNAQALEFTENVTKQVSNNVLNGASATQSYPAKDGTVYVLVEYSLDTARQATLNAVKKEEGLFNELKARQSLESLEEAIKSLK